jgi:hypothetical protein
MHIARTAHATKSAAKFYIIDSDFSMDTTITSYQEIPYSIAGDPTFENPDARIHIWQCLEWPEYKSALAAIRRVAKPGDWVCVDFISNAWTAVQEEFSEQVFGKSLADYFLEKRKELSGKDKSVKLDGWKDYGVINPMYKQWINDLLYRGRWHVYCTAISDVLSSDRNPTEDPDVRELFLRYQLKPVGQKHLTSQFLTILLTGRKGKDIRTITAVKDKERPEVSGIEVKNFAIDYLVNTAGWKLA